MTSWFVGVRLVLGIVAVSGFVSACTTPRPPKKVSVSERVQFDRAIGYELAQQFEPEIKFKKVPEITAFLRKIGQSLADATADLHLPSVDVDVFVDEEGKYTAYGLPGGKLYVSTAFLKTAEFENEVAAILAIQLGHLQKEHALEYLRKNYPAMVSLDSVAPGKNTGEPVQINYLGAGGLFDFTEKQRTEAIEAGVNILYAAGYDPRGLVTVYQRLVENPGRSPYPSRTVDKLLETTRSVIALHSPLRNPIVRTQAFVAMRKRFQKL